MFFVTVNVERSLPPFPPDELSSILEAIDQ